MFTQHIHGGRYLHFNCANHVRADASSLSNFHRELYRFWINGRNFLVHDHIHTRFFPGSFTIDSHFISPRATQWWSSKERRSWGVFNIKMSSVSISGNMAGAPWNSFLFLVFYRYWVYIWKLSTTKAVRILATKFNSSKNVSKSALLCNTADKRQLQSYRRHLQIIFLYDRCILITIFLQFISNGPISNKPDLLQIIVWRRTGDE